MNYALVTGASQGIGEAIALELARRGFGIVAVARSREKLDGVVRACAKLNGDRAIAIVQDLMAPDAVDRVISEVDRLQLDVSCLVNNAGQAAWGLFSDVSVSDHRLVMRLALDLPMELTHRLLPRLVARGEAYILNVGSMAAYTSIASMSTYSGSKAFLLRWSRALRMEVKKKGVRVTCLMPGSVITGFTERAGMQAMDDIANKVGSPPAPVARAAVRAMLAGRAVVVPRIDNRLSAWLMRVLPERWMEKLASSIYLSRLPRRDPEARKGAS